MTVQMDSAAAPTTPAVWDELVSELPVGLVLQDERGDVLAANRLAGSLLGLSRAELLSGKRPDGWRTFDDSGAPLPKPSELSAQVLRTGAQLSLAVLVEHAGLPHTRLWVEFTPVRHRGRGCVLIQLNPVHDDMPHSRGLLDSLTGLPGRALLLDRLQQALTRARTLGTLATLVLVDVHHLAKVNAEYGFDKGDELLAVLGGRLRAGVRADHTVARYGGDEFAVVAEHPNGDGAAIADRIRELAERPVRMGKGRALRPELRVSWVTSDGKAPLLSVLDCVEKRLHH
ncbi:sensor domain-containing diguanylate cyclase [Allokutzneria sp. A3M-2-11 16]|uniref:sensor domain-containing diguanylate cyclase n=1 Tax=Allokutzneria sp. A3M-2-11 16 TaxID=2962043 RepID=UPI0020B88E1D|nr:sensor domain-containing diguanylate cyclase [Allokutzneria sp. A3M-2-11 16]MCP3799454.1 sensor domain-containing diguanylate cyclase [Allokutzneria sp. A3M-2-11 16]